MPKIDTKNIDEKYFEHYPVSVIMPNGEIVALSGKQNECNHKEAFNRLIIEIKKIYGIKYIINKESHIYEFLEFLQSKGLIVITTYYIYQRPYVKSSDIQIIGFPKKTKLKQFQSLNDIINAKSFDGIGVVEFKKYGNKETFENLQNLIIFIQKEIKQLEGR